MFYCNQSKYKSYTIIKIIKKYMKFNVLKTLRKPRKYQGGSAIVGGGTVTGGMYQPGVQPNFQVRNVISESTLKPFATPEMPKVPGLDTEALSKLTGEGHTNDTNAYVNKLLGVQNQLQSLSALELMSNKGKELMKKMYQMQNPAELNALKVRKKMSQEYEESNKAFKGQSAWTTRADGKVFAVFKKDENTPHEYKWVSPNDFLDPELKGKLQPLSSTEAIQVNDTDPALTKNTEVMQAVGSTVGGEYANKYVNDLIDKIGDSKGKSSREWVGQIANTDVAQIAGMIGTNKVASGSGNNWNQVTTMFNGLWANMDDGVRNYFRNKATQQVLGLGEDGIKAALEKAGTNDVNRLVEAYSMQNVANFVDKTRSNFSESETSSNVDVGATKWLTHTDDGGGSTKTEDIGTIEQAAYKFSQNQTIPISTDSGALQLSGSSWTPRPDELKTFMKQVDIDGQKIQTGKMINELDFYRAIAKEGKGQVFNSEGRPVTLDASIDKDKNNPLNIQKMQYDPSRATFFAHVPMVIDSEGNAVKMLGPKENANFGAIQQKITQTKQRLEQEAKANGTTISPQQLEADLTAAVSGDLAKLQSQIGNAGTVKLQLTAWLPSNTALKVGTWDDYDYSHTQTGYGSGRESTQDKTAITQYNAAIKSSLGETSKEYAQGKIDYGVTEQTDKIYKDYTVVPINGSSAVRNADNMYANMEYKAASIENYNQGGDKGYMGSQKGSTSMEAANVQTETSWYDSAKQSARSVLGL
ncbi:MAG: hypothetical protein [Circular genetic element sp.]|nr:MAG: hypothetical protein [Circular genetic element sp.]